MLTGHGGIVVPAWVVLPLLAAAEDRAPPRPSKGVPGSAAPGETCESLKEAKAVHQETGEPGRAETKR